MLISLLVKSDFTFRRAYTLISSTHADEQARRIPLKIPARAFSTIYYKPNPTKFYEKNYPATNLTAAKDSAAILKK